MINNLPDGWRVEKVKNIVKIKKGKKVDIVEEYQEGLFNYIDISVLRTQKYKYTDNNQIMATEKDILIVWDGANSGYSYFGLNGAVGSTLAKLSLTDKNILHTYFGKFIFSKFKYLSDTSYGATIPHLQRQMLENINVPIPPLPQQEKIVKVLDISSDLIEKQKKLIERYDLFLKSKFIEMFGDPIKNPMEWEIIKIEDIIDFLTSGSRGWAKYYSTEGEVFIRIQNVKNGNISFSEKQYINAPSTQEAIRTKVKENDLLLSITADLGRTGVVNKALESEDAYISQHLALLRLKEGFSAIYVSAFIETEASKLQFDKLNQGGTKAGLNFNAINSFKLFNPPVALQNKFALIVEKIETIKEQENKRLELLETLHNSLMDKAFRGEI